MNRRDFIRNTAVLAAAQATAGSAIAASPSLLNMPDEAKDSGKKLLIDTPPVLQNYAESSIGIAFGVTDMANGYTPHFPTVIDGQMKDGKLVVQVFNVITNERVGEYSYAPRKVKKLKKNK